MKAMVIKKCTSVFIVCGLFTFSMVFSSCSGDPSAAMRHELLRARKMNADFVPMDSVGDSAMKEAVAYYDLHGTRRERVEAHYLLGCIYRDMGEAPQALKCYHDAVDCAGDTELLACDGTDADLTDLLVRVYGQMAELYDAQNLPGDEISAMRQIQRLALLEHDSLMYIRAIELMTKPYYKLGDTAKVVESVWEAHRLYTEMGDSERAVNAFATLAHIMVRRGQLEEAGRLLGEFETRSGLFDEYGNIQRGREMYYYIKGNYCLAAGRPDSAEMFLRKLLPGHYPADAYRGLLAVFQNRAPRDLQCLDSIVKYARLFEAAIDSQNNTRRIETVHQMAALYDYHRYRHKADAEALAAAEARSRANIAIGLIAVILIGAGAFFMTYRKSKQKELEKMSEECLVVGGLLAKARMELDEERKTAESINSLGTEMQEKLEEKTSEVEELERRLQQLEQRYRSVIQLTTLEDRINSEAVKTIRRKAEWKHGAALPSADEWIKLTNQFRLDFPHYYSTLVQEGTLSIKELRTCILLMLGFKEGEIAVLLDVKPQRVTNIKKRANMKLFDDSSATTLKTNIQSDTL